ncbi:MAG: TolC family protein [Saprospiraceae bacterium]
MLALLAAPFLAAATDSLTVEQCRQLALQNSPLQQKKLLAESIAALQLRNVRSNSLPRFSVNGQATWQSDVFGLPISSPLFEVPTVPKDQYKLALDVAERLYDGGSDKIARQQRDLENQLAAAQVDVDVFQLREVVTDLFFKTLLLQKTDYVLLATLDDLQRRLRQTEAMVAEGVALRTAADQIRIQVLKTNQQIAATRADKTALLETLAKWLGRENVDFALSPPSPLKGEPNAAPSQTPPSGGGGGRPETQLFALQQRNLALAKSALDLKARPKVEAFVQTGFGRPNPFNFFETGFEPFAIVGLRATWTPYDWGNRRRDAQVLDLQAKNVAVQQQAFDQRLGASLVKDRSDAAKMEGQLKQDADIIALQEDIVKRTEAQVKNGVATVTDYLAQVNLLTQARLTRATHEVQMWQAQENLRAKTGE